METRPVAREIRPLDRRDAWAMAGVFGLALFLRLLFLYQVQGIPFIEHPISDARAYDEWAQRIAAGDWWGDQAFYQAPAYPYFLAVLYKILGHDLWAVHVIQMGLGSLSCVIVGLGARVLFGFGPGLAAGLIMAVYPPAIYFDAIIGKQGLGLLLTATLLGFLYMFQRQLAMRLCVLAGAALGVLALTRENALALIPAVALWLWFRFLDASPQQRGRWLAAFMLGLALILLPVGLRNYIVGDTFSLTTSQMGTNFYIGNSEEANGLYVPLLVGRHTPVYEATDAQRVAEKALGRALDRGEVSDYFMARGFEFIVEHPVRWVGLIVWKVALTWNAFEIPDTEDIYAYAEWSWLLSALLPLLHFGWLAPLAVLGLVLAWKEQTIERRDLWLIGWLAFVYTGSIALFITFARFRYPLVPMLAPLAGFALVRGAGLFWSGEMRALRIPLLCALLAFAAVNVPLLDEQRVRFTGQLNLAGILLNLDRADEAEGHLRNAAALEPVSSELELHWAMLRFQQERYPDAERHVRRMLEIESEDHRGYRMLSRILRKQGRVPEARRARRRARALDPDRSAR
jgi:4-amino-4-deoxy-L-arabinose transferase-like glycosyltransferase